MAKKRLLLPVIEPGAKDRAHLAYGKAMSAWANVERACYAWFEDLTLLNPRQARGIFYSARGFEARMSMLKAALEYSGILESDKIEFARETFKKASIFSKFRNKLAHGEFTLDGLIVDGKHLPKEARTAAIDHKILKIAARNFQNLADSLQEVLDFVDETKTPESSPQKHLPLILALPDQANSNQPPRRAAKPPRRRRTSHRAK